MLAYLEHRSKLCADTSEIPQEGGLENTSFVARHQLHSTQSCAPSERTTGQKTGLAKPSMSSANEATPVVKLYYRLLSSLYGTKMIENVFMISY